MSDHIRSFIAVPISPEVREQLRAAQDELRRADADVKWVAPENFHITLKFLGGVTPDRLEETWKSVVAALAGTGRFTMRFRGAGAFPSPNRPRVIWAGVSEGADDLAALAARVEEACAGCGFPSEERPFRAHLTLGRARRPAPSASLRAAIEALADRDLGEVEVARVQLMRSQLTPSGAIYQVLQEHTLAQEARYAAEED